MLKILLLGTIVLLLLPALAEAADISGVPKIREGDLVMIGNSRIRLGGIDAPSVDQFASTTRASAGPAAWPRVTN